MATTGSEQLKLSVEHRDPGICVVRIAGELDMATTPALTERLRTELAEAPGTLVIELSGLEFLGSAGLAALVEARQDAAPTNLVLAGTPRHSVARALQISGAGEAFQSYPSADDAVAAASGGAA